jgi:glycosyltransferase 2 family protein
VFVAGAALARRGVVGAGERRLFARVNSLPGRLHRPWWVLMQLGSLGGALGVATAAAGAGRPDLARRLAIAGPLTWVGAKAVKPFVGRGRPSSAVATARVLGREQRGLGYPSGHAAVVAALYVAARPDLGRRGRLAALAAVAGVAASRSYVGAHLPLDVAGGLGLGAAIGATIGPAAATPRCRPRAGR